MTDSAEIQRLVRTAEMVPSSLFSRLPLAGSTGACLPAFVYGTAWKKELTTSLVEQALNHGFTAIDTACQPRHYREDLAGEGIRKYLSSTNGKVSRSDLFIQTKFTSVHGQDPNNIPYNPKASLSEQVHQSIAMSLKNLAISDNEAPYLDSLVLHSPMPSLPETLEVWTTLEQYVPHKIRHLGISNINLSTLMDLYERTNVKPAVVQNRFYADTKYDISIRKFCAERGMIYQSFWTLTANPRLLKSSVVVETASLFDITQVNALYCLVLGLGNTVVLNGTKNMENMHADWEAVGKVKRFVEQNTENQKKWQALMQAFRRLIGELID